MDTDSTLGDEGRKKKRFRKAFVFAKEMCLYTSVVGTGMLRIFCSPQVNQRNQQNVY